MNYLIQALWIEGEAQDRGVHVTQAQILKSYATQRKTSKPPLTTQAALNNFLAKSGQTKADLLWRTKLNLLATGIQQKVIKTASKVTQQAIAAVLHEEPRSVRDPDDAEHAPDRDELAGERRQGARAAAGRFHLRRARVEVLDRPDQQGRRR